jgi:hypothetical protein
MNKSRKQSVVRIVPIRTLRPHNKSPMMFRSIEVNVIRAIWRLSQRSRNPLSLYFQNIQKAFGHSRHILSGGLSTSFQAPLTTISIVPRKVRQDQIDIRPRPSNNYFRLFGAEVIGRPSNVDTTNLLFTTWHIILLFEKFFCEPYQCTGQLMLYKKTSIILVFFHKIITLLEFNFKFSAVTSHVILNN